MDGNPLSEFERRLLVADVGHLSRFWGTVSLLAFLAAGAGMVAAVAGALGVSLAAMPVVNGSLIAAGTSVGSVALWAAIRCARRSANPVQRSCSSLS